MLYSPNGVEWYRPDQLANQPLARYIRLVNESDVTQTLGASELNVATKEITAPSLVSTTFGVDSYYGNNNARNLDDLSRLLTVVLPRVSFSFIIQEKTMKLSFHWDPNARSITVQATKLPQTTQTKATADLPATGEKSHNFLFVGLAAIFSALGAFLPKRKKS